MSRIYVGLVSSFLLFSLNGCFCEFPRFSDPFAPGSSGSSGSSGFSWGDPSKCLFCSGFSFDFQWGFNTKHQTPGGEPFQVPTNPTTQLALSKDGRYALGFRQTRNPSSCQGLQDEGLFLLHVIDLQSGKVRDIRPRPAFSHEPESTCLIAASTSKDLRVLIHPDSRSFFLLENYGPTGSYLRQIEFTSLRVLFEAKLDSSQTLPPSASWLPWISSPEAPRLSLAFSAYPSFLLSSSGRFLLLRKQMSSSAFLLLDLHLRRTFAFEQPKSNYGPLFLQDFLFDPKEAALFALQLSPEQSPKPGITVVRLDLATGLFRELFFPSAFLPIRDPEESVFSLQISPDSRHLVLSSALALFLLDSLSLTSLASFRALGPVAFSPDGHTILAWDGFYNEKGDFLPDPMPSHRNFYAAPHTFFLINRFTHAVQELPFEMTYPTFFIPPQNKTVVTTSIHGGDRITLTDLSSGSSRTINGSTSMKNFSSTPDGKIIYLIENGKLFVIDLRSSTFFRLPVPLSFEISQVVVMPDSSLSKQTPFAPTHIPSPSLPSDQAPSDFQPTSPLAPKAVPFDRDDLLFLVSKDRSEVALFRVSQPLAYRSFLLGR